MYIIIILDRFPRMINNDDDDATSSSASAYVFYAFSGMAHTHTLEKLEHRRETTKIRFFRVSLPYIISTFI